MSVTTLEHPKPQKLKIVIPEGVRTLTGLDLEGAIAENAKRRLEAIARKYL